MLFVIFKSVPGDEATMMAGATATQAEIEVVRHQLGLDRPLLGAIRASAFVRAAARRFRLLRHFSRQSAAAHPGARARDAAADRRGDRW